MAGVPADLQWQIIRNNSSFRRRCRGVQKHFSTEPFNLMGVNSIRYNGLIHKKAIDVRPTKDNKGVQLVTKNAKRGFNPAKSTATVTLKKNSRKSLKSIKKVAKGYRGSQVMLAQRRASQLMRALKPVASRRGRHVRKQKTDA